MLGNMVIFANSILVNSIIVLIIKAKVSKPTCEGRLAFYVHFEEFDEKFW